MIHSLPNVTFLAVIATVVFVTAYTIATNWKRIKEAFRGES